MASFRQFSLLAIRRKFSAAAANPNSRPFRFSGKVWARRAPNPKTVAGKLLDHFGNVRRLFGILQNRAERCVHAGHRGVLADIPLYVHLSESAKLQVSVVALTIK